MGKGGGMTDVHYCPFCELRFSTRNELVDHMAEAHPQSIDDDTQMPADPNR
jgi:hypothetical protein